MLVYRLAKKAHARDISGTGAAMFPGRWNKKGTPVLYTSESIALSLLELVLHTPPMLVPNLELLTISIPEDSVTAIEISDLPSNWQQYPAPAVLGEIGEKFIHSGETVALKVPSCIVPDGYNYILNCSHEDYGNVRIIDQKPFYFDPRLKG